MNQLDFNFARAKRDVGIARSALSAGNVWTERAIGFIQEWCARHPEPWVAELCREYAETHGLESPPTKKSWGPAMQEARRRGIVRAIGYAPSRASHCSPKCLWVRA